MQREKIIDKPLSKYPYPIPSREEILGVLRTNEAPLAANDIAEALSIKRQEREGFFKRLAAMERDGQIRLDQRNHYQLTHPSNFVGGRVQGHRDGYGFLVRDDGQDDLFLPTGEMQKVMHNDRVLARIVGYDRRGRPEGHIVEVTDRANKRVIGRLLNENGALIVAPEDKRIGHDILITQNTKKAKVGQVVVVELTDFPSRHSQPLGRVVEVLGDIDDPGMEIEIAVRKYGVPHEFSQTALDDAARLPDEVRPNDIRHRIDLRDVPLVTIDGEDARDFDDAVYCEPVAVGKGEGFRLLVAIADVSHYVHPNSGLDVDAIERSTSVYFPRRVIPMLPEKLSNGLCSLNPHVDRCVLVCDMVITARGEIKAYQFYPGVMHSSARLTYTEVAAVLKNTKGPEAARRATLLPQLQNLYGVYKSLFAARQKRGAIDFDTTETYIVCNAQGKIEQIIPRTRNDAHKLIEECMRGRLHEAQQASGTVPCARGPDGREAGKSAYLPARHGPHARWRRHAARQRLRGADGAHSRPARRADAADHAAAFDAAGGLQPGQYRPLRPRVRSVCALHEPDPPLPRSADAPCDLRDPPRPQVHTGSPAWG
jgi:ribonuclease R